MNDAEKTRLFESNAALINQMNPAAGGLVMALLDELERNGRNTYIELRSPAPRGHTVEYEFREGNEALIALAARSLGFKSWTAPLLEVHGG